MGFIRRMAFCIALGSLIGSLPGCGGGGGNNTASDQACSEEAQPSDGVCIGGDLIQFGSVQLPPGESVIPETGDTLFSYDRTGSTDYIEMIGTEVSGRPSLPLTVLEGITDGVYFSARYANNRLVKYFYRNRVMDVNYDADGNPRYTVQSAAAGATGLLAQRLENFTRKEVANCNTRKQDYEERLKLAELYITTVYLRVIQTVAVRATLQGLSSEEIKAEVAMIPYVIQGYDSKFSEMLELHAEMEQVLATYDQVCGVCAVNEVFLNQACVRMGGECPFYYDASADDDPSTPNDMEINQVNTDNDPAFEDYVACSYHDTTRVIQSEFPVVNEEFHGIARTFTTHGVLWTIGEWVNGLREGDYVVFYPDTLHVQWITPFLGDLENGTATEFRPSGQIRAEYPMVDGEIHGDARLYNDQGDVIECWTYVDGEKTVSCLPGR